MDARERGDYETAKTVVVFFVSITVGPTLVMRYLEAVVFRRLFPSPGPTGLSELAYRATVAELAVFGWFAAAWVGVGLALAAVATVGTWWWVGRRA